MSKTLRPAEEIAREMVPESNNNGDGIWRSYVQDQHDYVPLERQGDRALARAIVGYARALIVRTITVAREDGAAAERSRSALRRRNGRPAASTPDLAGRIRALVIAWADRYLDSREHDTSAVCLDIVRLLRRALRDVAVGAGAGRAVAMLRTEDLGPGGGPCSAMYREAADELEAMVRDAGEQR